MNNLQRITIAFMMLLILALFSLGWTLAGQLVCLGIFILEAALVIYSSDFGQTGATNVIRVLSEASASRSEDFSNKDGVFTDLGLNVQYNANEGVLRVVGDAGRIEEYQLDWWDTLLMERIIKRWERRIAKQPQLN